MLTRERPSLLLSIIVVLGLLTFLFATLPESASPALAAKPIIKVLKRRVDRRKDALNPAELAELRRTREERQLEDKIPKHVPIKVKLKEEKAEKFKDVNNINWTRDLELEVTNTSDKPIYYLSLWLIYADVRTENGGKIGADLSYGRRAFIHFSTVPTPSDVPILPHDTITLVIPDNIQRGWLAHKARAHLSDPKKIEITFTQLSFGDGSGFNGSDAMPYRYKRDEYVGAAPRNAQALGER